MDSPSDHDVLEMNVERPRSRRWISILGVTGLVAVVATIVWGFLHHPGYDEIIPGDAQPIAARVTVNSDERVVAELESSPPITGNNVLLTISVCANFLIH